MSGSVEGVLQHSPPPQNPHHARTVKSKSSIPNFVLSLSLFRSMGIETTTAAAATATTDNHQTATTTLIFTYGTLKRGFSNHVLMLDLIRSGDAVFKGTCRTADAYPLVCGPYRVPFLLNLRGAADSSAVAGELYAVSAKGLTRLDELEGINRGHYERSSIRLIKCGEEEEGEIEAEAYYAHQNYAAEMWKRNGRRGYGVYGEKEAKGYVKRKDRPQNLTFLEQIRAFVSSPHD